MAWRRNLQVSSVGTSAERLGVGADHDGGRAAGAKGAATEETRKGLRLRILPGTGCHRAGPPSKSGARAGGGRSDDFTQSNCGGTEAELATSATTCLHPQPPSRAYICVRNHKGFEHRRSPQDELRNEPHPRGARSEPLSGAGDGEVIAAQQRKNNVDTNDNMRPYTPRAPNGSSWRGRVWMGREPLKCGGPEL